MGLRNWIKGQLREVLVEELERIAEGKMSANLKGFLEAIGFMLASVFLASVATALQDGGLTKQELVSALAASIAALAAYLRQPAHKE